MLFAYAVRVSLRVCRVAFVCVVGVVVRRCFFYMCRVCDWFVVGVRCCVFVCVCVLCGLVLCG